MTKTPPYPSLPPNGAPSSLDGVARIDHVETGLSVEVEAGYSNTGQDTRESFKDPFQ
jgi:hypothetical protein